MYQENLFIKRELYSSLYKHLRQKEIILLTGPRQVGKTTLLRQLQSALENKSLKTLFLSLDFEEDKIHFQSQRALLQKIDLHLGKEKGIVFIDEIQRQENAGLFLKGLYDLNTPYKFIVSGSGSLELKEKIHESLAGRKRIFELSPITFKEFIDFKTSYAYVDRLDKFFEIEKNQGFSFLEEYLNFGGYPRVVLESTLEEKRQLINEIYQSYLEKDISYLLKIEKSEAFSHLMKLLADQFGQLINFSKLANSIGISIPTVKKYLWYAQKTYVIDKVTPFFKNRRKEIVKSPVFYFYDLGLRNYMVGSFGDVRFEREKGFLFQNVVFLILKEMFMHQNVDLHFWRTQDDAEVDLVIDIKKELIPIEVKYSSSLKVPRSLLSFIKKYHPKRAFIITRDQFHDLSVEETTIRFMPFWKLITDSNPFLGATKTRF